MLNDYTILVYNKERDNLESYKDLMKWAKENIEQSHIYDLDNEYYQTGMTGWEVIYNYLTSNAFRFGTEATLYNGSDNFRADISIYSDLELYRILKEENDKFNMSMESSNMDLYYDQGYWTEELEDNI